MGKFLLSAVNGKTFMNLSIKFSAVFALLFSHFFVKAMDTNQAINPKELKIITYNVWFDPFAKEIRNQNLLHIIKDNKPDVACFQEVTFDFFDIIKKNNELLKYYDFSLDPLANTQTVANYLGSHNYGVLMLVKKELKAHFTLYKFNNSKMERRILAAKITKNEREILLSTTHLESLLGNSAVRASQLLDINNLHANASEAIFTGDLNLSTTDNNNGLLEKKLPNFTDTWKLLHPNLPGHTFDGTINKMIGGASRMRYDRVLFKSQQNILAKSIEIIGNKIIGYHENNVARPIFPSDHYGLLAIFEVN